MDRLLVVLVESYLFFQTVSRVILQPHGLILYTGKTIKEMYLLFVSDLISTW